MADDGEVDVAELAAHADRLLDRLHERGRPIRVLRDGAVMALLVAPEHLRRLEDLAGFAADVSEGLADSDGGRVVDGWTLRAREDLEAIRQRLAVRDPDAARLAVEQLRQWADYAAMMPRAGRVVPELGRADLLEVIVGDYRILYRPLEEPAGQVHVHVLLVVDAWPFPALEGPL